MLFWDDEILNCILDIFMDFKKLFSLNDIEMFIVVVYCLYDLRNFKYHWVVHYLEQEVDPKTKIIWYNKQISIFFIDLDYLFHYKIIISYYNVFEVWTPNINP